MPMHLWGRKKPNQTSLILLQSYYSKTWPRGKGVSRRTGQEMVVSLCHLSCRKKARENILGLVGLDTERPLAKNMCRGWFFISSAGKWGAVCFGPL